ncbi:MAG: hypothetical protein J6C96_11045 [Oscillospiraceae bacterium]|nr:hypothetical protein [Oscillospiraceae bacterium]
MSDVEKENMNEEETVSGNTEKEVKKSKGKSFMQVYREVNAKERAEELKREAELEAEQADKERKARDSYAEKLRQEKLELLKLKQGVISEEDIPKEEKIEKHYTVWERIGNFFYHNKMYIIMGAFAAAIIGFLAYDMITTVRPDVAVMVIARDPEFTFRTDDMSAVFEQYCEDYNGDKKVNVRVSYLPAVQDTSDAMENYYGQAEQTKLMAEFQAADSIIVIADYEAVETIGALEDVFGDLSTVYPDDENVTELGYMLNGTSFAEDIGYDELADDLFIAFRMPKSGFGVKLEDFQKNYDNAVAMWTNYLNGNVINPPENSEE